MTARAAEVENGAAAVRMGQLCLSRRRKIELELGV